MARTDKPRGDYEVGYGKPPEHTRFQKGHSGNARGKIKGRKAIRTLLTDALLAQATISLNGAQKKGPRQQLLFETLTARAAVGDLQAQKILIPLMMQILGPDGMDAGKQVLSAQDQRILDQLLADMPDSLPNTDGPPGLSGKGTDHHMGSDTEEHF